MFWLASIILLEFFLTLLRVAIFQQNLFGPFLGWLGGLLEVFLLGAVIQGCIHNAKP